MKSNLVKLGVIFSILVVGLGGLKLASAQLQNTSIINEDNGSKFLTFKDTDLGVTMNYPSDWTLDNSNNQLYTVAHLKSPNNDVYVDLRVFPKSNYKSLKDYGDRTFKEAEDLTLLQYYRNSTTLLDGRPALRAIYFTTTNPGLFGQALGTPSTTSKAMMVATMVPEKKSIYALTYFADSSNFNTYLPAVEQMIKSFQIGNAAPIIQEEN